MSDWLSGEEPQVQPDSVDEPIGLPKRRKSIISFRRDWPLMLLLGALLAGWILYSVILPQLQIRQKIATSKWKFSPKDPEISSAIWFIRRTVEYWFFFWFFYLGASIGSFINVVASRTPRKKTIVSRGSHCPFCDKPLNMIDNSPVFGWVLLRGRCRACRLPISPRYLIMEIIVGLIFVALGALELIGNGINLPYRDWRFGAGIAFTVFYPKWDLIGALVVHLSLFAIAVMLIGTQTERLKFPKLPLIIFFGIYFASCIANPTLLRVSWTEPWGERFLARSPQYLDRAITSGLGALAGVFLALFTAQLLDRYYFRAPEQPPQDVLRNDGWIWHWTILHLLAGTLLGWQAIVPVSLIGTLLAMLGCGWLSRRKSDGSLVFPLRVIALAIWTGTLFVHVCAWRWIVLAWN